MMKHTWVDSLKKNKLLIGIWGLFSFLLLIRLDSVPPLWFDEGCAMTVARNWIELGHYGRLINGVPYPETILNIGLPVIAPISLSFFLFGVGILQARFTIVIFTLAALLVFYKLIVHLYNRKIALASLLVILFLPFNFDMNPIFVGRQALGELPALFYMISGYLFFLLSQRKPWAVIIAIIFWVLAILSKFQILPFLCLGLAIPAMVMVIKHNPKQAILFGLGLVGTILIVLLFGRWTPVFNSKLSDQSLGGLFHSIVFIPNLPSREAILSLNLPFFIPVLLGMLYAVIKLFREEWNMTPWNHAVGVKISIMSLITSWFVWFFTVSVGWSRHLTIPLFLGSMFIALAIHDLTCGFKTLFRLNRPLLDIKNGHFAGLLFSILIIVWVLIGTFMMGATYVVHSDKSILEAASFINSVSDENDLIETTDYELFPFLNRKYHFPPDEIHLELVEQRFLEKEMKQIYNPLEADPDYIVVGRFGRNIGLYNKIVESEQLAMIKSFKNYDIYAVEKSK